MDPAVKVSLFVRIVHAALQIMALVLEIVRLAYVRKRINHAQDALCNRAEAVAGTQ